MEAETLVRFKTNALPSGATEAVVVKKSGKSENFFALINTWAKIVIDLSKIFDRSIA